MGAIHERRLISAVLRTGDIRPALSKGIGTDAMPNYEDVWAFLLERFTKTKRVPTADDVRSRFPDWVSLKVNDVDLHAGAVAEEHSRALAYAMLHRGGEDLAAGIPVPKLLENLAQNQRGVTRALGAGGTVAGKLSDSRSYLREVKRRQELAAKGGAGVLFGIPTLDEATGGMTPGQFVIVCSRPSVGKSFLLARAAVEGLVQGKNCLFISLEMNRFSVQTRMLSMLAHKDPQAVPIDPSAVRKGSIGRSGVLDINRLIQRSFGNGSVMGECHILDKSDPSNQLNEHSLQAAIERAQPDLVFLDYLQLWARMMSKGGMDLRLEVARVSSYCKGIAEMFQIPFVTASQINRAGENRNVPPSLKDLAESDSPGQDADVVVTMVPPSRSTRKACVAKNREGPDNDIFHIHFNPREGCIEEVTAEQAEQIVDDDMVGP